MKLSILHITLCYFILLSPISYIFNRNLDVEDAKRVILPLTATEDCETLSVFKSLLIKVKQGVEDDINETLDYAQQQSKNQAVYQKLQNLFLPTQLLKNAETTGSHFTAVPIFAYSSRIFLNARQFQGSYLSYATPLLTQNLYILFEVYLI